MSEVLVKVYIIGIVESLHRVSLAVVNKYGELLYYAFDPYYVT
ncbi:MAG TPA: asparaginase, partial [Methanomicrobia archaeon]|nr:asparaginase [Methanomicrobia archaeon]